jgi:hypothetical protein
MSRITREKRKAKRVEREVIAEMLGNLRTAQLSVNNRGVWLVSDKPMADGVEVFLDKLTFESVEDLVRWWGIAKAEYNRIRRL